MPKSSCAKFNVGSVDTSENLVANLGRVVPKEQFFMVELNCSRFGGLDGE
jgi:hypothetical protein